MSAPDDQPEPTDPQQPAVDPTPEPVEPEAVQPEPLADAGPDPVVGEDEAADPLVPAGDPEVDPDEPIGDPTDPAADPADPPAPQPVEPQRSGSPLLVVGVVVLLLALVGGVYLLTQGGSDDPAFTAYGEATSREQLAERLDGLVSAEALETLGSEDATTEQQTQVAQAMSTLITLDVLGRAAEEEGVTVTEEDVDAQLAEVVETAFGGDQAAFDAQLAQAGLTLDTVRAQFRTALLAEGLVEDETDPIDPAEVQAAYDAQFNLPTVSHILTETEEEAQAAADRIAAGEDFAAVAQEVSIDPGSGAQGGELGPLQPGAFVPEFEEAALELDAGEVSEPVETQFGYHIITVDEPVPFAEVEEQLTQAITDRQLAERFTALAERLDAEAEITVDPVFGTWTGLTQGGLQPPGLDAQTQPGLPAPAPSEQ